MNVNEPSPAATTPSIVRRVVPELPQSSTDGRLHGARAPKTVNLYFTVALAPGRSYARRYVGGRFDIGTRVEATDAAGALGKRSQDQGPVRDRLVPRHRHRSDQGAAAGAPPPQ